MSVHNIQESNALLLYKVGPVFVCSPTMPVEAVVIPPKLTVPPGSSVAEPGMFKSMHGMVRLVDLRVRFGVDKEDMNDPGKIVIVEVEGGHAGFWVDEIEDVISFPTKGWSQIPAYIPKNVFSRTLVEEENIRLYADFEKLDKFKSTGYLRKHIEMIKVANRKQEEKKKESLNVYHEAEKQISNNKITDAVVANECIEISDVKKTDESSVYIAPVDKLATDNQEIISTGSVKDKIVKANNTSTKFDKNRSQNLHVNKPNETTQHKISQNRTIQNKTIKSGNKESSYHLSDREINNAPGVNDSYISKIPNNKPDLNSIDGSVINKAVTLESAKNINRISDDIKAEEPSKGSRQKNSAKLKDREIKPLQQEDKSILWIGLAAIILMVGFYYLIDSIELGNDVRVKVERKPVITEYMNKTEIKVNIDKSVESVVVEPLVESGDGYNGPGYNGTGYNGPESEIKIVENESVEIIKNDDGVLIVVNELVEEDDLIDDSVEMSDYGVDGNDDLEGSVITDMPIKEEDMTAGGVDEELKVSKDINNEKNYIEKNEELNETVGVGGFENKTALEGGSVELNKTDEVHAKVSIKNAQEVAGPSSKKYVHVVVKGDTLWFIAKRYVHNPWRYPELAKLSNIKNPDLIYPGDHVTIIINYKHVINK